MLQITPNNCTNLNVVSSDTDIIEWIQGTGKDFEQVCNYEVKLEYNCCEIIYNIRPYYTFQVSVNNDANTFFVITGMYYNILQDISVEVSTDNLLFTSVNGTATDQVTQIGYDTGASYLGTTHYWRLTITNNCNHTYVVTFQTDGSGTLSNLVITYPDVPTELEYDNNDDATLVLNPVAFNMTDALEDGVYQVSVTEYETECLISELEVDNWFLDCDVRCKLAKLIVKCDNPEAIYRYHALLYNNTCKVLTYQEMCDIYRLLTSAIFDDCVTKKPCNCN
jgi:hypothetical protein